MGYHSRELHKLGRGRTFWKDFFFFYLRETLGEEKLHFRAMRVHLGRDQDGLTFWKNLVGNVDLLSEGGRTLNSALNGRGRLGKPGPYT